MKKSNTILTPYLKPGDYLSGFRVNRVEELKLINSIFIELIHSETGARYVHISNSEKENTFSVAFKTVPSDSTGVAHILEHTVLCGSKKYPVRDPFFSMLKRSLSSFMNAFTSSDWTMYPFSTQNKKDFYNLMDVYLDATFFPKLDELSFKQEGHRLEFEDTNANRAPSDSAKLVYKGVVYNEMKGAMSSPSDVMIRSLMNALYPDTTYSNNSGGDPADIPGLTYEQLKKFHNVHYHPCNSFFYTYGDIPLTEHVSFINDKILKHFKRIDINTVVSQQKRWLAPKQAAYTYPLASNEDPQKKYQFCLSWLTADIRDTYEVLILALLEHILLGNPASPLYKALIESEIGSSLSDGTGYDADNRDTMFSCGLKDIREEDKGAIEKIIFNVLEDLVKNKIDKELIESAIHQIEFSRKEISNTPYPYGLKLLLIFSGTWFHGGDPVKILNIENDFERLRHEAINGYLLEDRIKKYFLGNNHRVHFLLVPDQGKEKAETERVEKELKRIKSILTEAEIKKIADDTAALEKLQNKIDDVSCLPTLEIQDIPPDIQMVADNTSFSAKTSARCYAQSTSGIFYATSVTGSGRIETRLLSRLSFFSFVFSQVGTKRRDYIKLARFIDRYTGGVSMSVHARTSFKQEVHCLPFISFGGKCLERNLPYLFEIMEELIFEHMFSDMDRLKNLLFEYRAGLESMVVQSGHRLAISLASRNFSHTSALEEMWHGIHQVRAIKTMTNTELSDDNLNAFSNDLSLIGKTLFHPENFKIALIGDDKTIDDAVTHVTAIQKRAEKELSERPKNGFVQPDIKIDNILPYEGWHTSTAVSFVAKTFKTVRLDHRDAPALSVISKLLRSMYLHREIREKGGAYGGFATYNAETGLFSFASYRDPHICRTLDVFDGAASFIRSGEYTDEDIKEAILQVCSEIDKPDTPATAASKAFFRKIISLSDETRQKFKEDLLSLTREQVKKAAEKYFTENVKNAAVAVISSEDKLKEANKQLKENKLTIHSI